MSAEGDPGSVSALAADLAAAVADIRVARELLVAAAASLADLPMRADGAVLRRAAWRARRLADTADALSECAQALQAYAVARQHARAAATARDRLPTPVEAFDAAAALATRIAAPVAVLTRRPDVPTR